MLHRLRHRARTFLGPIQSAETARAERTRDALRAGLTPRSFEIQQALVSLNEHLDAVDWCARHIAATREPALRVFLAGVLDAERSGACDALAAVRVLDAEYARRLCRLLFRAERRAFERSAALLQTALSRTAQWGRAKAVALRDERYGT